VIVNGAGGIASACVGQSLIYNVFDESTFKPWKNVDNLGNNLFAMEAAAPIAGRAGIIISNFRM
jgi:hypothetical protein